MLSQLPTEEAKKKPEASQTNTMPARRASQRSGRVPGRPDIPPLPADKFYAGVQKKREPVRKPLSEVLRHPQKEVTNPYRSYTVSYKLRVLSYWIGTKIPYGPTRVREPTQVEKAERFKIPAGNLSRWKKEEEEGKFTALKGGQRRAGGGGRGRVWAAMEKVLFEQFRERRAMGRPVRRGWFRRVSKGLIPIHDPGRDPTLFRFSNGWFRSFLRWDQISLRFVTNTASQLPADFAGAILNWLKFNRRNSQTHEQDINWGRSNTLVPAVGHYRLQNICNLDQTPVPYEYLGGQTYNLIGEMSVWLQSSKSGWEKRKGTTQLTVFADGISRVLPLIFFRGQGIGPTIGRERQQYDPCVIVKFNPTAYANSSSVLEWQDEKLIPILDDQPTLLAIDLFQAHQTAEVLDTFRANDIAVSLIPGGCTCLVQPLDISINRPFKDI